MLMLSPSKLLMAHGVEMLVPADMIQIGCSRELGDLNPRHHRLEGGLTSAIIHQIMTVAVKHQQAQKYKPSAKVPVGRFSSHPF